MCRKARDLGIRQLIQNGATWLACTDADSVVSPDWLRCQILHQPTDAICGIVTLDDLSRLSVMKQKIFIALSGLYESSPYSWRKFKF